MLMASLLANIKIILLLIIFLKAIEIGLKEETKKGKIK